MRVAVILVAVVVIATPAHAATSCMSKSEARRHFGDVHIYWHGPDHCWDASPGRRRYAAKAQSHVNKQKEQKQKEQKVHEARQPTKQPKWREARSEIVADNEPARVPQEAADQPVAKPQTAPIRMTPVKVAPVRLASILTDWSERWVDVDQVVPDHLIKAQSSPFAAATPTQDVDVAFVVRGVALVTFGLGLVLTFVALLMRSGSTSMGVPPTDRAPRGFGNGPADPEAPLQRTGDDGLEERTRLQSWAAALPALFVFVGRSLQTIKHLVVILILQPANSVCWSAVRWVRHVDGFASRGAYPVDVKWSSNSAGAMISGDDTARPFTVPSRLLEEKRQAASHAMPPHPLPKPPARTS